MATSMEDSPFSLSDRPLEEMSLDQDFQHESCGAAVTFVGRVRNRNLDRDVLRLDYEGAEPIARNEFAKIAEEAKTEFGVIEVRCVHRVGSLAVGDAAVWIGVLAPHRAPAFEACRYVIDELKKRVPIWKKEFYAEGDSGWIGA